MEQYTELLDYEAATLSPDEDDYEERLLEVAQSFRSFNEALSQFVCENGFDGQNDDVEGKLAFLRGRFKSSGVPVPREIKDWFNPGKSVKRDTAFQICFAFGLNVESTNEFFKKVFFERSFDCHSITEAVYYYCAKNGLPYQNAIDIISKMPKDKKGSIKTDREILYTGTIVEFINGVKNETELIEYVNRHFEQFGYNNATAKKRIQTLWEQISSDNGLAYNEGVYRDKAYNQYHYEDESLDDDYATVEQVKDSTWRIYAQILGLDKYQTAEYGTNRTIKPLLENNILLSPLAEASFPDRDGIEKITKGAHVSHERVRKLLILLEFYSHWANIIVENKDARYMVSKTDSERCIDRINRFLLESGYPELYPGNPYDWIFMWAVNDQNPLQAFREYMGELFAAKHGLFDDIS